MIPATSQVVADTHVLVWYLTDSARLSSAAQQALEACVADDHPIVLNSISLVELASGCRAQVNASSSKLLSRSRKTSPGASQSARSIHPSSPQPRVAELLGLNVRTVMAMANDGRLEASRLPGSRKYHFFLENVLDALARHRVGSEPKSSTAGNRRKRAK